VDPLLFDRVAHVFGKRAIAIVLSGMLNEWRARHFIDGGGS
jgi:chemotaxis response regulator CheB